MVLKVLKIPGYVTTLSRLVPKFQMLDYEPQTWSPSDKKNLVLVLVITTYELNLAS